MINSPCNNSMISPVDGAKIAAGALKVNVLRSLLTMLGIVIGVGAVIVMVAVGTGAREMIGDQIRSIGSNLILVIPGATLQGGAQAGFRVCSHPEINRRGCYSQRVLGRQNDRP